jgi:hypothetical protein
MSPTQHLRPHTFKDTVETNGSETNRTFERLQHVQKCKNFTSKQNRVEEEAAMRYYVCRAFIIAVIVSTLFMLSLQLFPTIITNLLNRKCSNITPLYTYKGVDDVNYRNPLL